MLQAIVEHTQFFKAIADATRLRIVRLMAANAAEACVCELVDSLDEPQYHISRHLRELRACGLLLTEKDGRWVYYRLSNEPQVKQLAQYVAALPAEPFSADQRNFEARLSLREADRCRVGIQKAHLSDAPLSDAPLSDAPLSDAPLSDAPLSDAPLSDAPAEAVASAGGR